MAGGVGGGVVFNPHKRFFEVLVGIMGLYARLSAFECVLLMGMPVVGYRQD